MGEAARRVASQFVAEIDEAELTVRIAEIAIGLKRPPGKSAAECLAELEERSAADPVMKPVVASFGQMARAAVLYFGECVAKGRVPS